jgi:hypothetical protein
MKLSVVFPVVIGSLVFAFERLSTKTQVSLTMIGYKSVFQTTVMFCVKKKPCNFSLQDRKENHRSFFNATIYFQYSVFVIPATPKELRFNKIKNVYCFVNDVLKWELTLF